MQYFIYYRNFATKLQKILLQEVKSSAISVE